MTSVYYTYSDFLKERYGEKVYKLPINLPVSCPNRDGTIGTGGCTFCSEVGTGFESCSNQLSVSEQLIKNKDYISRKYKANKFIAYFQNYTNTHMPLELLKERLYEAYIDKSIVEIAVSTRPDCLSEPYLKLLEQVSLELGIPISLELGLQTTNDTTLLKINRGHTVADFVNAVERISSYSFEITVHLILNLPGDTMEDVRDMAELVNQLEIPIVKIHSLYLAKDTKMAQEYINHEFEICTKDEYIERVIEFLSLVRKEVAIARLLARAPKEETDFCNWQMSWWRIHDEIVDEMKKRQIVQGCRN